MCFVFCVITSRVKGTTALLIMLEDNQLEEMGHLLFPAVSTALQEPMILQPVAK